MAVNIVIPANIALEISMLVIQMIVFKYSYDRAMYTPIDRIYIVVTLGYLIGSFVWLRRYRSSDRVASKWSRALRSSQAILLITLGGLILASVTTVQESDDCWWYEKEFKLPCQRVQMKQAAGVLAVLDGVIYFADPCRAIFFRSHKIQI